MSMEKCNSISQADMPTHSSRSSKDLASQSSSDHLQLLPNSSSASSSISIAGYSRSLDAVELSPSTSAWLSLCNSSSLQHCVSRLATCSSYSSVSSLHASTSTSLFHSSKHMSSPKNSMEGREGRAASSVEKDAVENSNLMLTTASLRRKDVMETLKKAVVREANSLIERTIAKKIQEILPKILKKCQSHRRPPKDSFSQSIILLQSMVEECHIDSRILRQDIRLALSTLSELRQWKERVEEFINRINLKSSEQKTQERKGALPLSQIRSMMADHRNSMDDKLAEMKANVETLGELQSILSMMLQTAYGEMQQEVVSYITGVFEWMNRVCSSYHLSPLNGQSTTGGPPTSNKMYGANAIARRPVIHSYDTSLSNGGSVTHAPAMIENGLPRPPVPPTFTSLRSLFPSNSPLAATSVPNVMSFSMQPPQPPLISNLFPSNKIVTMAPAAVNNNNSQMPPSGELLGEENSKGRTMHKVGGSGSFPLTNSPTPVPTPLPLPMSTLPMSFAVSTSPVPPPLSSMPFLSSAFISSDDNLSKSGHQQFHHLQTLGGSSINSSTVNHVNILSPHKGASQPITSFSINSMSKNGYNKTSQNLPFINPTSSRSSTVSDIAASKSFFTQTAQKGRATFVTTSSASSLTSNISNSLQALGNSPLSASRSGSAFLPPPPPPPPPLPSSIPSPDIPSFIPTPDSILSIVPTLKSNYSTTSTPSTTVSPTPTPDAATLSATPTPDSVLSPTPAAHSTLTPSKTSVEFFSNSSFCTSSLVPSLRDTGNNGDSIASRCPVSMYSQDNVADSLHPSFSPLRFVPPPIFSFSGDSGAAGAYFSSSTLVTSDAQQNSVDSISHSASVFTPGANITTNVTNPSSYNSSFISSSSSSSSISSSTSPPLVKPLSSSIQSVLQHLSTLHPDHPEVIAARAYLTAAAAAAAQKSLDISSPPLPPPPLSDSKKGLPVALGSSYGERKAVNFASPVITQREHSNFSPVSEICQKDDVSGLSPSFDSPFISSVISSPKIFSDAAFQSSPCFPNRGAISPFPASQQDEITLQQFIDDDDQPSTGCHDLSDHASPPSVLHSESSPSCFLPDIKKELSIGLNYSTFYSDASSSSSSSSTTTSATSHLTHCNSSSSSSSFRKNIWTIGPDELLYSRGRGRGIALYGGCLGHCVGPSVFREDLNAENGRNSPPSSVGSKDGSVDSAMCNLRNNAKMVAENSLNDGNSQMLPGFNFG